ncbi:ABC transporter ATP-binding protein [Clostridium botulinum]|uniref:ABC transporter ATP-binding protein n=1 Tax=Clostridium botulinum TaxID=1491 RepID=UPI0003808334|nr:ABC transporter ATP-binding protein [Clostridium botulinum]MBN1037043.1 ABC transporter ATP-binding protein [Clostridium botulinum]MBY6932189.1 ABC transporter ATP-binding protein [Clostridium botulinum]NFG21638.1 ABC transporter ATP-binding protein [Clostridium botulinum]NFO82296.1 ABC transporter ATP-binding protein [Clostridium botulinum]
MEVLRIEELSKTYGTKNNRIFALRNVSFSLHKGEILAIMGTSGSGKSTLLNILGALDSPDSGKVYINGLLQKDYHIEPFATKYRSENIGFIFQSFNLLRDLNVEENVALPLILKGIDPREVQKKVDIELELVGLMKWKKHRPLELSGGQQQRVAIARAKITEPNLLLADEPTGNLDYNTSLEVLNIFKLMREKLKQSIIIVTHDPMVASYADRVLFFSDGQIIDEYKNKENNERNIDIILDKFKGVINKHD